MTRGTPRGESAPLAATASVLAALALVGLAHAGASGPRRERAAVAAPADAGRPDAPPSPAQIRRLLEERPMDLNAATASDLELLPRIGPTLARRIVEERRGGGRFQSVHDLQRVRGIGARTVERLRPLVAVPPPPDAGP